MAASMGTGVGAASLISRSLGAGNHDRANRCACVSITLGIFIGVFLGGIYLFFLDEILRLFGATGHVLELSSTYMSILARFAFLHSSAMVIGNLVRAEGSPFVSGLAMVISAIVNIILDPIFIFGLGPVPRMEIAGAATATIIAQMVGLGIYIFYFLSGRTSFHFSLRNFLPNISIIAEIYRVGAASMVRMGATSVVMALANTIAASFGVTPLAVLGVVFRLARFTFMPTMGLGQGMLPLVGFNFGAQQKERVGEAVLKAGLISLIWGLTCWSVFMIFSTQIMSIFSSNPQFLTEGTRTLRIFVLFFFAVQLQMISSFFFQGIGKGVPSFVLSSARPIIFLIPCLLFLPRLFDLMGLWVSFPVADILSVLLTLIWTRFEFRKQGLRFRW